MLEIVYQDEDLIAINKPHGLLVHKSPIAKNALTYALQELRNQIGQHVFPLHRLDRKTSGVLLFALNEEVHKVGQQMFADRSITKKYLAVVRGYTEDSGEIDYPLKKENGKMQDALTKYKTLVRTELPISLGKHLTIRYSLVEVEPETGRMHQIRKHFAHILHPIIGDRPHGCNKQNRFFKERWNMETMLLHASELIFLHPVSLEKITIRAKIQEEFARMKEILLLNEEVY